MEGKEIFLHNGGESYEYIPCLNDSDPWIQVIKTLCEEKLDQFYLLK